MGVAGVIGRGQVGCHSRVTYSFTTFKKRSIHFPSTLQRDPSTQLRYGLIRFTNNAWPSSVTQTYFSGEDRVAIVPQSSDDATLKIYKAGWREGDQGR